MSSFKDVVTLFEGLVRLGKGLKLSDLFVDLEKQRLCAKIKVGERYFKAHINLPWTLIHRILVRVIKQDPNPFDTVKEAAFSLRITGIPRLDGQGLENPPWLFFHPVEEKATAIVVGIPATYSGNRRFRLVNRGLYCFPLCYNNTFGSNGASGEALILAVVDNQHPLVVQMPDGTFTVANMDGIKEGLSEEQADQLIVSARAGSIAPTPTMDDHRPGVVVAKSDPEPPAEAEARVVAEPTATLQSIVEVPPPVVSIVEEVSSLPEEEREAKTRRERKPRGTKLVVLEEGRGNARRGQRGDPPDFGKVELREALTAT